MGVYNKKKCEEMLLEMGCEPGIPEVLNEDGFDTTGKIMAAIMAAMTTAITITCIVVTAKDINDYNLVKRAIKKYEQDNPNCKPIGDYTRKIYSLQKGTYDPNKEYGKVSGKIRDKLNWNRCVCFFDEDEMAMLYGYRSYTYYTGYAYITERKIAYKVLSDKAKKHEDYYIACFLREQKMINKKTVSWAKKVLKDDNTSLNEASISDSEEAKIRKEEFNKVVSATRDAIKNAKSKHGKDFDFFIKVDYDENDYKRFCNQEDDEINFMHGGLYPPNKPAKYNDDLELEQKRTSILDEIIKEIRNAISKDKTIRGKIEDDWSYISFGYNYKIK